MTKATRNSLLFLTVVGVLFFLTLAIFIVSSRFYPSARQREIDNFNNLPMLGDCPGITAEIHDAIIRASTQFGVDTSLIKAIIKAESGFDPKAVGEAGEKGLMQLLPKTALAMGVKNAFNPGENISGGTRYLARLVKRFNSVRLALAAYNAGPGRVKAHKGIPPYPETRKYVKRVMDYCREYSS